ncbi:MAG: M14 family zinc carboxypeptidase [candidate division WOR-3 bacterium]|nr:M14 family zinc carboxypeptidase [candidate division WOR-3 bacterium]MCX7757956.1 M14 family zinc carboxypeptidase [candidate division WOR-3 bacterium]MDW7987303.1 M14 family zinc carboxypeptidase [candidate division WOR-3 bacterium]
MRYILIFLIFAIGVWGMADISFAAPNKSLERLIKISVSNHDEVYLLQDQFKLSVIDAQEHAVYALANDDLIEELRSRGYKLEIVANDYRDAYTDMPQIYHSYAQVCSMLVALRAQYPAITKLETLGYSAGNRAILGIKVSDNPGVEELEPEVRLVGAHHGNEKISTEITLAFLQYLLSNYAFNPQVSNLVNNREIWIVPVFNPDGHVNNSRYNGAGVDLNRDYGYMWSGEGSSSAPFSQPETRAMRAHAELNNITLEYEYHSAASYVNYVWDHHPKDPPDSGYIITISQEYADSTYGSSTTQLQKINGYDWYYVRGSAQDAMFGIWGGIGTTIETQQPSTQARVDSICLANRRALMKMILRAGWGISGLVKDSITEEPLFAMIKFINPKRWTVYTDKICGDFHKMVAPGNYTFQVEANGYLPKTFTVTVPDTGRVFIEVKLVRDTTIPYYVQKIVWVRRDRPDMSFTTVTMDGLGIPDNQIYSLGPSGVIVLEAIPPIRNFPGADFVVYEGDLSPENYSVAVSNDWRGSFFTCGQAQGTQSFDLSTVGLDSARYIRITNTGGGSSSDPYAGFDLDGISYRQNASSSAVFESSREFINLTLKLQPNPAKDFVRFNFNGKLENSTIKIYDVQGRLINELRISDNVSWNLKDHQGRKIRSGIYFCQVSNKVPRAGVKLIVK